MKRVLVLAAVLVLGLGAWAFAADPLSGSVEFSLGLSPSGACWSNCEGYGYGLIDLSATVAIDYTVVGWVFGSSSGFDNSGYSAQSFSAAGTIGAFSFDSSLLFKPMNVTAKEYAYYDALNDAAGEGVDAVWDWCWYGDPCFLQTRSYAAAFDSWTAKASVSIAGVTLEGIFFLKGTADDAATKPYAFFYSPSESTFYQVNTVPTWGSDPEYSIGGLTSTPTTSGAGFRFKIGGMIGGLTLTSYTYFNLTEASATAACGACGYSFARKGTFKIANPGCDVTFTEQYLTVEGFGFGCATADVALSIGCSGFSYAKFLLNNVDLGLGGITIDALITFTTSTKTFTLAPCITLAGTCLDFEVALDYSGNTIGGLSIYGVSFEQTWNGITFSSKTALDTDNSCLFGLGGMEITDPCNQALVMVPLTGLYDIVEGDCCDEEQLYSNSIEQQDRSGFYTPWCIPTEKYVVWEAFSISTESDGCCGGAYSFSLDTYFGSKQTLKEAGYHYVFDADMAGDFDVDITQMFGAWLLAGEGTGRTKLDSADDITTDNLGVTRISAPTTKYVEELAKKAYYRDATQDTLFEWVETDLDFEIGLGSNFTITAGLVVNVYGWQTISFGAGVEF